MPPVGWKVGNARHVEEGENAAVLSTDALLAESLPSALVCGGRLVLR